MTPGLTFFIDRGVGSVLVPGGLRDAGWTVETMDERYGLEASQRVADTKWIRDAAARGDILITKDRRIAKRPLEAEAIVYSEARVLVLASAQVSGPIMLEQLLVNADAIVRIAVRPGPWVYGVYDDRLGPLRINYS